MNDPEMPFSCFYTHMCQIYPHTSPLDKKVLVKFYRSMNNNKTENMNEFLEYADFNDIDVTLIYNNIVVKNAIN